MHGNLSEDIEYRHFRGLQQGLSNFVCTLEFIVDRITESIHQLTRKHSENIGHVHHMATLNSWKLHVICHIPNLGNLAKREICDGLTNLLLMNQTDLRLLGNFWIKQLQSSKISCRYSTTLFQGIDPDILIGSGMT
jgi:hypothetical protein